MKDEQTGINRRNMMCVTHIKPHIKCDMKNKPDLNGDSRYDYNDVSNRCDCHEITDVCDYPYIGGQKQKCKHRKLSEEEVEQLTY